MLLDGSANIRELNKEMNWQFPTEGPKTLNGLILEYLEDIPQANISLRLAGYPRQDHERFLNNDNIIWRADVAVILYSLLGAQPWQLMYLPNTSLM